MLYSSLLSAGSLAWKSGSLRATGRDSIKLKNREGSFILGQLTKNLYRYCARLSKILQTIAVSLYKFNQNTAMKNIRNDFFGRWVLKDGYSFHASYDSLDVTYDEYKAKTMSGSSPTGNIDYKAIIGDGGTMGGKDSQVYGCYACSYRLTDRWVVLNKSVASIWWDPSSPRRSQSKLLSNGWSLVKIPLPIQSESTYAANLEMATNEYKPE